MKPRWLIPVLAASLSACSGATLRTAPKMPDYAQTCATQGATACQGELQRALEKGDRGTAGQLLLLAARTAPAEHRRALARAALWLAPQAWAPEELRTLLDDDDIEVIASSAGAASRLPAGTVLRLRGGTASFPAGIPTFEVDLGIPRGDGPLAGDSLASLLATAAGADSACYASEGAPRLVPASPLMSRVLGAAVPMAPDAWQSARTLANADRALRAGRRAEAWLGVQQAVSSLPASSMPCATRGALDYLRATVSRIAFAGNDKDALDELKSVCTSASVPVEEAEMQRYLREVVALQSNLSTAPAELPEPWAVPAELERWSRSIDDLSADLGDGRGTILRALRDDLVARASQPKGRCDVDWGSRALAAREAARQSIAKAGRDDLVLPTVKTRLEGVRVQIVDVDGVLSWVEKPENRWLRVPTLAGILADPSLVLASEVDRPNIERVCGAAFDELLREIKEDRLEGYDERNVARWFSASRGVVLCRRMDAIGALSDELLKGALQGKSGKAGALRVLMLTGFQALEAFLNGRGHEGMIAVKAMKDGLQRLSAQLGAGDEDRVLDAVITVVGAAVDRVMGSSAELAVALERAAATLEPISRKPIRPDAPDLVRAAPGIHLAALALLAAVNSVDEDPRGRDAALLRLQASVDRDVLALLEAFGAREHGPAIQRIARAASTAVRILEAPAASDVDTLLQQVREASAPGPSESRWWAVGLNLARVALWDVTAHSIAKTTAASANSDRPQPVGPATDPRMNTALDDADKVLVRLAEGILRDWGHAGTSWEFLHMAPAVHRGMFSLILAPEGAPDLGERAVNAMQGDLGAGLGRMSKKVKDAKPDEVGFLAVLIDGLELAQPEGGLQGLVQGADARQRWARRLREQSAAYPAEFRIVIDAATAAVEFDSNQAESRRRLQNAAQQAAGTQFGDVAWLPLLAEAVLLHRDGDTAAALQAVEGILKAGSEATTCNKPHEVFGLLPYRAWALESLGRHADADASLQQYLDMTRSFGGDGFVQCRLVSYRNSFTFTADVKQRVGSFFFPTSSEGTFQIGAGYGDARNYDRLACASSPLMMPRLDLVMNASLMRAAYALRKGDDAAAHVSLLGALGAGRGLIHGDVNSLGVNDGASVEEARKHAFVPLIMYVAEAARGRGHISTADQLEQTAQQIASARTDSITAAFDARPGIPPQLDGLGFDALEPFMARMWKAAPETKPAAQPRPGSPGPAQGGAVVPAWGMALLEAQAAFREGKAGEASGALRRARPPAGDAVARVSVSRIRAVISGGKAPAPRTAEVLADMSALSRAGLYGEVQSLASSHATRLVASKKTAEAADVLTKALAMIPAERAKLARADLLIDMATLVPEQAANLAWANDMASVESAVQGRIPLPQEIAVLQRVLAAMAAGGDIGGALAPVERMQGVLQRALGAESPESLKLGVAVMMLRSLDAEPPARDVAELLASAHAAGAAGEPLVTAIDAWKATQGNSSHRRTLVLGYLRQMFGP